jgi:predicted DNA-binding protein
MKRSTNKLFACRLSPECLTRLREIANKLGITVTDLIRLAVLEFVNKRTGI